MQKSFSRWSSWFLAKKINFENWKCPFLNAPNQVLFTMYEKILWGSSFGCKNLLNFICQTMKFHNCHHTWWAGGGYIGSWMESTAFAAEMEPMVERWETVTAQPAASRPANMEVAASSSWWLLLVTSSGPQCWPLVEADFFARKQRGIVWNTEIVIRNCKASKDYTLQGDNFKTGHTEAHILKDVQKWKHCNNKIR